MSARPHGTPPQVDPAVQTYMRSLGAVGARWLDTLPDLLDELTTRWDLRLGAELTGGIGSYVRRVDMPDGGAAVLKIALPGQELRRQAEALAAADGVGYVRRLGYDDARGALLLESLTEGLHETTADVPATLDILGTALSDAWNLPLHLHPHEPATTEHKASTLAMLISDLALLAAPADRAALDRAQAYLSERLAARDSARQVVVHGDPHPGNLLAVSSPRPGARTGYVFIDPEAFRCEPEYDVGVVLRDWSPQLLASPDPQAQLRCWCARLAGTTGTDPEAVWQWAFAERVSTGLYLRHHGLPERGEVYLDVASRLLT